MYKITPFFKFSNFTYRSSYWSSFNCYKCKKDHQTTQLECRKCGYLLDPEYSIKKTNFYTLFGISPKYNIDKNLIQQKAKQLQKKYHPDKFTTKDNRVQLYSNEFSSYVNQGKEVLLNDIKRGLYLLQMKGVVIKEEEIQGIVDNNFLMDIFEKLENISESREISYLQNQRQNIRKIIKQLKQEFSENIQKNNIQISKIILMKYKYYDRVLKNIQSKLTQQTDPLHSIYTS